MTFLGIYKGKIAPKAREKFWGFELIREVDTNWPPPPWLTPPLIFGARPDDYLIDPQIWIWPPPAAGKFGILGLRLSISKGKIELKFSKFSRLRRAIYQGCFDLQSRQRREKKICIFKGYFPDGLCTFAEDRLPRRTWWFYCTTGEFRCTREYGQVHSSMSGKYISIVNQF